MPGGQVPVAFGIEALVQRLHDARFCLLLILIWTSAASSEPSLSAYRPSSSDLLRVGVDAQPKTNIEWCYISFLSPSFIPSLFPTCNEYTTPPPPLPRLFRWPAPVSLSLLDLSASGLKACRYPCPSTPEPARTPSAARPRPSPRPPRSPPRRRRRHAHYRNRCRQQHHYNHRSRRPLPAVLSLLAPPPPARASTGEAAAARLRSSRRRPNHHRFLGRQHPRYQQASRNMEAVGVPQEEESTAGVALRSPATAVTAPRPQQQQQQRLLVALVPVLLVLREGAAAAAAALRSGPHCERRRTM